MSTLSPIASSSEAPYEVGPSLRGHGFLIERVDYSSSYRRAPHEHETFGITLVIDGQMREVTRGVEETATSLSYVVKPAGTVHSNEVGPRGARVIAVSITEPAALLGDLRATRSWRWNHTGPCVKPLLELCRSLYEPERAVDPAEGITELLGELIDEPAPRSGDAPTWIQRAREALDDQSTEGIAVGTLAESLGVHPVSLTRAFRRAYGVSVTEYRQQVRLRRAAAHVARSNRTLSEVAHFAGYADHPHMCREIRTATGLSPSALREMALR